MILWRIASETRSYSANDLSGNGASRHPGRWNDRGQPVVHCAPTIAMAVLETAAHIDDAGLPLNRYLVEISVPDAVWSLREERSVAALPANWNSVPAGRASVLEGSKWLASLKSPILLVPSVIVPEEMIALINPAHARAASIKATTRRKFEYDRLFRNASRTD